MSYFDIYVGYKGGVQRMKRILIEIGKIGGVVAIM